jgi:hypothetical protein
MSYKVGDPLPDGGKYLGDVALWLAAYEVPRDLVEKDDVAMGLLISVKWDWKAFYDRVIFLAMRDERVGSDQFNDLHGSMAQLLLAGLL